jgi:hypothetical protein
VTKIKKQKLGEKRRKTAITSTTGKEIVDYNAPTSAEEQLDIKDGLLVFQLRILGQQL